MLDNESVIYIFESKIRFVYIEFFLYLILSNLLSIGNLYLRNMENVFTEYEIPFLIERERENNTESIFFSKIIMNNF